MEEKAGLVWRLGGKGGREDWVWLVLGVEELNVWSESYGG
jgi:hypothetical protein